MQRTRTIDVEQDEPLPLPPVPVEEPESEPTPGPDPVPRGNVVSIDAHVMDKESLVHKSLEQDVLEEYQRKYEKRNWVRRLPMYVYARWRQNRMIDNRLTANRNNNQAIEFSEDYPDAASKRQQRIASSIANFA
jgi:hypothetical protein